MKTVLLPLSLFLLGACSMDHSYKSKNYDQKEEQFVNSTGKGQPKLGLIDMAKLMKKVFWDKSNRAPKERLPEVVPSMTTFLEPSETFKFIWFGHSTLLLNVEGKILLIDPVFSDNASPTTFLVKRFQPPVLQLEDLPPVDAIIISHNHYDHLDEKTILFFKDKKTQFILPLGVGEDLQDWGIPKERMVELDWNQSTALYSLKVTATAAQHFSGRGLFDRNKSLWASFVIQGSKQKIFYSGDSGYSSHFKEIGEKYGPFDVAFMENGQYNERWKDIHMHPEETLQAHLDLEAEILVPVHWGMFDLALHPWNEPAERLYKLAKNWDIPLIIPYLGQVIDVDHHYESRPWWRELSPVNVPFALATPKVGIK